MRKSGHNVLLILIALLWAASPLFAGGSQEKNEEKTPEQIQIQDALGNELTLKQGPQRIVLAGKATLITADALYLFPEVHGRVIGLGKTNQGLGDFFPFLDQSLDAKRRLAHEIGPEQIAALQPDLVVVKDFVYEKLGTSVARLGIPTVAMGLETPEQYIRDIGILGEILGNSERATFIQDFYRSSLEEIESISSQIPEGEKKETLLLYYSSRGGEIAFKIPPAGWIQTAQVEKAGGKAVWKESNLGGGWKTINLEQIAAWNPEYIFVTSYHMDTADFMPELLNDPRWQQLSAVQNKKMLPIPSDFHSWAQPDTRWILALSWIGKQLYPDRFSDYDIRQEVREFYTQLYGVEEKLVNEQVLPKLEGELSD